MRVLEMAQKPSLTAVEIDTRPRRRPGLKPGQRHSGQFKKGFDARRHVEGPRVVKKEFQSAIREHTDKAIDVLVNCMEDATAPWKERQAAAELVLSHAHGTPVNRILHAQTGSTAQVRDMSLDELMQRAGALIEGEVLTPENVQESTENEELIE